MGAVTPTHLIMATFLSLALLHQFMCRHDFMFKFYKLMGGESYTIIKIKMSITLLIKSTFLSVNSRTVLQEQFRHKSSQKYEHN